MANETKIEDLKRMLQTTVVTNVFEDAEFKEQFRLVFETAARVLSRTLGPYGSTTMIDNGTNYAVTKDGFHTLANLRFADSKQNRIYTTMFNVSYQMVSKVGDGSTSAVIAANEFLKTMLDNQVVKQIQPKVVAETIKTLVDQICAVISTNATQVNQDNLLDVVRNVANTATNGNKEYTDMIVDIYSKLGMNCDINIRQAPTFENNVIFEDGVYSNDNYLVDTLYHNRGNICHLNGCKVLMFDTLLEPEIFDIFAMAFNKFCVNTHETLVVIAPAYDQFLLDKIHKDCDEMVKLYSKSAVINFRTVFLKSNLTKHMQKYMYKDLASLLGADIIQPPDIKELTEWLNDFAKEASLARSESRQPDTKLVDKINFFIETHIGACEEAALGDRGSSFKGFYNKNKALFNICYHDAETKLEEATQDAMNSDTVGEALYDAKTRFSKINCKSATIEVGGSNSLEFTWNMDAVDDAVKACASAIKYGYNTGGNMAIINAVRSLKDKAETPLQKAILESIEQAFTHVYHRVLANAKSDEEAWEIVNKSIECGKCYDLVRECIDTDGNVINSSRTDIEILRGAITMVAIVFTCNQYISQTLNR